MTVEEKHNPTSEIQAYGQRTYDNVIFPTSDPSLPAGSQKKIIQ